MRQWVLLAGAALALTGCDKITESFGDGGVVERARESVPRNTPDPNAAQFRDVVRINDTAVCGEVNTKNLVGAYVGFKPFIYREFSSGTTAWDFENVDGCLFPVELVNQCGIRELQASSCHSANRNGLIEEGYPPSELAIAVDEGQSASIAETIPDEEEAVAPPAASDEPNSAIERLLEANADANSDCRGGTNPTEVEKACAERDRLDQKLYDAGYCYGKQSDEAAYQAYWHPCGPDSNQ